MVFANISPRPSFSVLVVSLIAALLLGDLVGCTGRDAPPSSDGGPATSNSLDIVINEVMAKNATILADEAGEYPDWIELKNRGTQAVDLGGMGLSDFWDRPFRFVFPANTALAAGAFVVVYCDRDLTQGPLHTGFRLSGSGEALILTAPDQTQLDQLVFGQQFSDVSYGRVPGNAETFAFLSRPTPGAANAPPRDAPIDAGTSPTVDAGLPFVLPSVVINEVLLDNRAGLTDLAGEHEPWIELYNLGTTTAQLDGLYLSDDVAVFDRWPFLPGTTIAPRGTLVLFADGDVVQAGLHVGFRLNAAGGMLGLRGPTGQSLDAVILPAGATDVSWARLPDGNGVFAPGLPTPNAPNTAWHGLDAGTADAGTADAGTADAGMLDAGVVGAGAADAGAADAGMLDAGVVDAGAVDAG